MNDLREPPVSPRPFGRGVLLILGVAVVVLAGGVGWTAVRLNRTEHEVATLRANQSTESILQPAISNQLRKNDIDLSDRMRAVYICLQDTRGQIGQEAPAFTASNLQSSEDCAHADLETQGIAQQLASPSPSP